MKNYIQGHENYTIHRTEYSSSLFDSVKNRNIWREILSGYIVRHNSQTA